MASSSAATRLVVSPYSAILALMTNTYLTIRAESEVRAVVGVVALSEDASKIKCLKMLHKRTHGRAFANFQCHASVYVLYAMPCHDVLSFK